MPYMDSMGMFVHIWVVYLAGFHTDPHQVWLEDALDVYRDPWCLNMAKLFLAGAVF